MYIPKANKYARKEIQHIWIHGTAYEKIKQKNLFNPVKNANLV